MLSVLDELSGILKKLSLEKYQPIFEEQEVPYAPKPLSIKSSLLCLQDFHFNCTVLIILKLNHQIIIPCLVCYQFHAVFTFPSGGHGGIPDSNRWRSEGAGH